MGAAALLLVLAVAGSGQGGKYSREANEAPRAPAQFRVVKLNQIWEKAQRVSAAGPGRAAPGALPGVPRATCFAGDQGRLEEWAVRAAPREHGSGVPAGRNPREGRELALPGQRGPPVCRGREPLSGAPERGGAPPAKRRC